MLERPENIIPAAVLARQALPIDKPSKTHLAHCTNQNASKSSTIIMFVVRRCRLNFFFRITILERFALFL